MNCTYKSFDGETASIYQNRNGNWTVEINNEKRYYKTFGGAEKYLKGQHYYPVDTNGNIISNKIRRPGYQGVIDMINELTDKREREAAIDKYLDKLFNDYRRGKISAETCDKIANLLTSED